MFLPARCPVCRTIGPSPCDACISSLRRAPPMPAPAGLTRCVALLVYEGIARDLVARVKYRNARDVVGWLSAAMASMIDRDVVDLVTWAPTTVERRRQRGFDQAELLARGVAHHLRRPARPLLLRQPGAAQTGRSRPDRWAGPRYRLSPRAGRVPANLLIVDDVVTTGATLSAAAHRLAEAGVASVSGMVAARTPSPAESRIVAPAAPPDPVIYDPSN